MPLPQISKLAKLPGSFRLINSHWVLHQHTNFYIKSASTQTVWLNHSNNPPIKRQVIMLPLHSQYTAAIYSNNTGQALPPNLYSGNVFNKQSDNSRDKSKSLILLIPPEFPQVDTKERNPIKNRHNTSPSLHETTTKVPLT